MKPEDLLQNQVKAKVIFIEKTFAFYLAGIPQVMKVTIDRLLSFNV